MSSDSELYEKKFKDVTLPHFVSGLSSILSFSQSVSTFGNKELEASECDRVKLEVEAAHTEMSRAEKEAKDLIESLTTDALQLAVEFDKAQGHCKNLEESLQAKKEELISLESQRYQVSDQLQAARSSLQHTENTLNTAEARKGEKITGRDMGIGLMLLFPCVDGHSAENLVIEDSPSGPRWRVHRYPQDPLRMAATGIPMAVDYNKELNSTRELVKMVEKEKQCFAADVKKNEEELKRCNSEIPERSKEVEKLKDSLTRAEREVETKQRACRALADTKTKLKYCYNYLFSLHGAVEVLYNSCEDLYSLEPIMPVIEETFKAIQQQNSHNELLAYDTRVQKLAKDLRAIQYQMGKK
ncbi:uncharacterized protein LOC127568690 isoform X1 [Pristis pectinata]|uniref:uncharacterized protein LOC127568690 isoform X1 n=1 Tax=Pristis pectinata TaxID=685728 RepID=UPI00223D8AA1|nr:uncharacterized protein LOC127568690 isoform X1 [Pristis pectinata]